MRSLSCKITVSLIVAVSIWVVSLTGSAREVNPRLFGSMMPYDFAAVESAPVYPDSLHPVYAQYVARHGARYLSGPKKTKKALKAMKEAEKAGTLTPLGREFMAYLDTVYAVNDGKWGLLSPLGKEEEQRLAMQVFADFPALAGKRVKVSALSTDVPRAIMTMYEFTHGLALLNRDLDITANSGPQNSALLHFFSVDSAYSAYRGDHAPWRQFYRDYLRENVAGAPALRLIGKTPKPDDPFFLPELTMEIYGILQGNTAYGLPAPDEKFLTEHEFEECWKATNLQHYLRNTISPFSEIAGRSAAPLMERLIEGADSIITVCKSGEIYFDGYFGHAETLLPLLSLMHLPGCYWLPDGKKDLRALPAHWQIQDVTPLAANILIVYLQSDSGRLYTLLRVNGRTVSPLPGEKEFTPWSDLRAFWMKCMAETSE